MLFRGKNNMPLTPSFKENAPKVVNFVNELKNKHPSIEKILYTEKDLKDLHNFVSKNAENKKLVDAYRKTFFDNRVWVGTIAACAKKDTPIGDVIEDGYLVGKHSIRETVEISEGFLFNKDIKKSVEYSWRFPVDETMLNSKGYSLDSENIILQLDLIVNNRVTCDVVNSKSLNNVFTTKVFAEEHIQILSSKDDGKIIV
ncbi:MAG: hypothetical protein ABIH83_03005, partial [Candidatus Micrarchaeota archaeon]